MSRIRARGPSQRQGSSENLKIVAIVFVALTVFALGACVLLYTELRKAYEEVVRTEAKAEEADRRWQRELQRAEALAKRSLGMADGMADGLDKTFGEDFKPVVLDEETDWTPESLVDLIEKLRNKITSLKARSEGFQKDVGDRDRTIGVKEKELKSVREVKEAEISKLRENMENEKISADRLTQDYEEKLTAFREETRTLRKALVEKEKVRKKEVEELKVEIENLAMKLEEAQRPPVEVAVFFEFDGKILDIDTEHKIVTIDLGRRDGVRHGFAFDVYPPGRPQRENVKGKMEISDAKQNVSTAKIMSEEDTNPIMIGDQIYNPLYSRHEKETFTLVGRFVPPHNAEWIWGLVEKHGGIPTRKVSDKTNYVVLGTDYEHLKDYKRVRELGLEVLRVQTLQKFFGW